MFIIEPEIPYVSDAEASIEDFCSAVEASLLYWYKLHTDRHFWAWNHISEWDSARQLFEEIQKPKYGYGKSQEPRIFIGFDTYVNWKDLATNRQAKIEVREEWWYKCGNCGWVCFQDWEPDCGCYENQEEWWENAEPASEDDIAWYLNDIGSPLSEEALQEALLFDAFDAYVENVHPNISLILEEVEEALERFSNAAGPQETLDAAMAALSIMHHSGNITEDYGGWVNLDDRLVDEVRSDGLTAIFDRDEIAEFLEWEE